MRFSTTHLLITCLTSSQAKITVYQRIGRRYRERLLKKKVGTLNLMWGLVKTATRFEYLTIKRLMKTDH